MQTYRAWLNL